MPNHEKAKNSLYFVTDVINESSKPMPSVYSGQDLGKITIYICIIFDTIIEEPHLVYF